MNKDENEEPLTLFEKYKQDYQTSKQEKYPNFFNDVKEYCLFPICVVIIVFVFVMFLYVNLSSSPSPKDSGNNYVAETCSPFPTENPTSTPYGKMVYITLTGECYHSYPHGNGTFEPVHLSVALDQFLRPCKICKP